MHVLYIKLFQTNKLLNQIEIELIKLLQIKISEEVYVMLTFE